MKILKYILISIILLPFPSLAQVVSTRIITHQSSSGNSYDNGNGDSYLTLMQFFGKKIMTETKRLLNLSEFEAENKQTSQGKAIQAKIQGKTIHAKIQTKNNIFAISKTIKTEK